MSGHIEAGGCVENRQYTENGQNMQKNTGSVKEEFCPICITVPMALLGAGTAAVGARQQKGSYQKTKKIMLWGGIILTIASVLITIYFLTRKCNTCLAK